MACFLNYLAKIAFTMKVVLALVEVREQSWYREPFKIVNRTLGHKSALPQWNKGEPVQVTLAAYVESISGISTHEMAFDVDMYLHLSWLDDRYVHDDDQPFLVSDHENYDELWRPDIFFANARKSQFHDVTVPNQYFRIYKNGEIFYSLRVSLKAACQQDLRNYPLDTQQCSIRMMSYGYTTEKVNVSWHESEGVEISAGMKLAGMSLVSASPGYCNGTSYYARTKSFYMHGNFSCLTANLYFERRIGYHLAQTYIPTMLIVSISWVSFFIDPSAIPARITLSFTTLLTLSTIGSGVRASLPPVDYAKGIDVWMGTCMAFVFLALLEFAWVNSFMRRACSLDAMPRSNAVKKITKLQRLVMLHEEQHDSDRDSLLLVSMKGAVFFFESQIFLQIAPNHGHDGLLNIEDEGISQNAIRPADRRSHSKGKTKTISFGKTC